MSTIKGRRPYQKIIDAENGYRGHFGDNMQGQRSRQGIDAHGINEVSNAKPKVVGMLDRIVMHGVDQSQPVKVAENSNDGMVIHLGSGGRVLGVGAKGSTGPKGTLKSIAAHPDLDLDNLPDRIGTARRE